MKRFLLLALLLVAGFANAAAPSYLWRYVLQSGTASSYVYSSADDACSAAVTAYNSPTTTGFYVSGSGCYRNWLNSSTGATGSSAVGTVDHLANGTCADGSTPDTTKPTDQQCPDPSACPALGVTQTARFPVGYVDQFGHIVGTWSPPSQGTHVAISGCDYSVQGPAPDKNCGVPAATASFPAVVSCDYTVGSLAGAATAGEASVPSSPPSPPPTGDASTGCPAGTRNVGTEADGTPMCAGESGTSTPSTSSSAVTTTTSNADGSTTRTTTTTTTNSDGSKTTSTTSETTSADGTVTTTSGSITGPNMAGSPGRSDQSQDLCTLHPELSVCRNSSVTGTCGEIACTGDAIQCAILRDQAARNCSDKADADEVKADPAATLGQQIASGNDPLQSTLPTPSNGSTVTMPSSLDTSGWLGAGACFPDKQFTLQGHVVTLSFTSACQPLLVFRYALMIVALLISFRMLSGVIFRE